jgi:hypothetical protein
VLGRTGPACHCSGSQWIHLSERSAGIASRCSDALQKAFSGKIVQQQQFPTDPTGGADTLKLTAQLQAEYNSNFSRLEKDWIKPAHADHGASKDTINIGKNFTGGRSGGSLFFAACIRVALPSTPTAA